MPTQTQLLLIQILEEMKKLTPEAINPNHLFDDARYFTKEGDKVLTHDNVQPVGLFNPVNRDIPSIVDPQGVSTKRRDMRNAGAAAAGAAGSAVGVPVAPADDIWEIDDIYASFLCSADVAARTCSLYIQTVRQNNAIPAALIATDWIGTDVNLAADQSGGIWMTGQHFNYINTNGAIAATVTDENIFPLRLGPGSLIVALYTANGQLLDQSAIDIYYHIRGQV